MKKVLLAMFALVASVAANAQVYLGGEVGFWNNDDEHKTELIIAPEVGYNLNEKWAVGAALKFGHAKYDSNDRTDVKANVLALAPYARYSFYENKVIRLFIDGGFGVSSSKIKYTADDKSYSPDAVTGFEIGVKPGISLKINEHFNFVAKCGFLGYRDDYFGLENGFGFAATSENLSFGFHYEF